MKRLACLLLLLAALTGRGSAQEGQDEIGIDNPSEIRTEPPSPRAETPVKADVPAAGVPVSGASQSMCLMIESAARANALPLEFFARVIWQESRFRPDAVGPVTRSGQRAQGIAQFMPGTAAERRLLDPFDPVQALPKSAEFLRELRAEFGNLGLAAAAYNAGPQRVRDWLAGIGNMPAETRNYVGAITGRSIDDWASASAGAATGRDTYLGASCGELMTVLRRAPNPFVDELERRINVAAVQPWGVQLSAGFSRERALSAFARLSQRYARVLSGYDPSILASVQRSRGTRVFYQVRISTGSRGQADELCNRVRRAGGPCMVLRNPRSAAAVNSRS
jgi:hypothetical protein